MSASGKQRPSINRLITLQDLVLQFHGIERTIRHPANFDRRETDSEHSYTLAMAGWFIAQSFPDLKQDTIIRLALVHDLIEVYAGDTYVYGNTQDLSTKADREAAAVKRLATEWQDFPSMINAIEEYELRQTAEAKFVYALDKLMPMIMNYLNKGRTWQHEGITLKQIRQEKEAKIPLSPEINEYYKELLTILQNNPQLFAPLKG